MKYVLVQGGSSLVAKVAATVEELLTLDFQFDPNHATPRVHKVDDALCRDETGAALMDELERQTRARDYRTLRVP